MKTSIKIGQWAGAMVLGSGLSLAQLLVPVLTPLSAQTTQAQTSPSNRGNSGNIDDVTDDPTQMRTWRCSQGDRAVVVEAKDLRWKPTIETNGWSCLEELSPIATNLQQFSCEPDESLLGIVTVTWLQGKEAKKQMRAWLNEFSANPTLVCTVDKTNPFWQ